MGNNSQLTCVPQWLFLLLASSFLFLFLWLFRAAAAAAALSLSLYQPRKKRESVWDGTDCRMPSKPCLIDDWFRRFNQDRVIAHVPQVFFLLFIIPLSRFSPYFFLSRLRIENHQDTCINLEMKLETKTNTKHSQKKKFDWIYEIRTLSFLYKYRSEPKGSPLNGW